MILLRHAESAFNVVFRQTGADPGLVDPGLTAAGWAQAASAAERLRGLRIERILASPYTRALETASVIAEAFALPVEVDATIGEHAWFACDQGTPADGLAARWPGLDFGHLETCWWPERREPVTSMIARCARFRRQMAGHDHDALLVVTHWAFVRALTGLSVENAALLRFEPI